MQVAAAREADVVHEDVQPAELRDGLVDHRRHALGRGDVRLHGEDTRRSRRRRRPTSASASASRSALRAAECHPAALARQRGGAGQSQPAARASDDGDLVGQSEIHVSGIRGSGIRVWVPLQHDRRRPEPPSRHRLVEGAGASRFARCPARGIVTQAAPGTSGRHGGGFDRRRQHILFADHDADRTAEGRGVLLSRPADFTSGRRRSRCPRVCAAPQGVDAREYVGALLPRRGPDELRSHFGGHRRGAVAVEQFQHRCPRRAGSLGIRRGAGVGEQQPGVRSGARAARRRPRSRPSSIRTVPRAGRRGRPSARPHRPHSPRGRALAHGTGAIGVEAPNPRKSGATAVQPLGHGPQLRHPHLGVQRKGVEEDHGVASGRGRRRVAECAGQP